MNNRLFAIMAATALVAGCAQEMAIEDAKPVGKHEITLKASIAQTKSTVTDAGIYTWQDTDVIGVVETGGNKVLPFAVQNAESGTFRGSLTTTPAFAVSPAAMVSEVTELEGLIEYDITLDNITDYVPGTTNAIMVAGVPQKVGDDYVFQFRHAAALVKVPVVNVPVGTAKVKLTMDKNITGIWSNLDTVNPIPVIDEDTDLGDKSLTLSLKDAITASNTSADFYFPVPVNTYTSFKFELLDADGNLLKGVKKDGLTITLAAADLFITPTITLPKVEQFVKVTSNDELKNGTYLIVYEGDKNHDAVAFKGSLETLDAVSNGVAVTIVNNAIEATTTLKANTFTISVDNGTVLSASGYYIGQTSDANGLASSTTKAYTNTLSISNGSASVFSGGAYLRYNYASNQTRFRYYKSASYGDQQAIQLYKLEDNRKDPGMSWSTATATASIEDGDIINFTAPTLTAGSATNIAYDSTVKTVATINEDGEVSILAEGTTTIKAIFAGNATYKSVTASYTLTVTDNRTPVINYAFESIEELNALASNDGEYTGTLTNAVVSFVPNNGNAIIKDATGSTLLYASEHGLLQGQTFSGEVTVTITQYQGLAELTACDAVFTGNEEAVSPENVTLSQLVGNLLTWQSAYVKVDNLEVTEVSGKNVYVKDGTKTYMVYSASANATCSVGDIISVTGTIAQYNSNPQIKAWSADDIVVTQAAEHDESPSESVVFENQNYTNGHEVSSYSGTDFTVSFNQGTNNNVPKYYTTGKAIRIYGGSYFTVSSTTKTITKIELTFGTGDGTNAITTDVNTYSDGTWTGSAASVKFTIGGTTGHRRIAGIKVTFAN